MAAPENVDAISTTVPILEQCSDIRKHNLFFILHVLLNLLHVLIVKTENCLRHIAPAINRLNQFASDLR